LVDFRRTHEQCAFSRTCPALLLAELESPAQIALLGGQILDVAPDLQQGELEVGLIALGGRDPLPCGLDLELVGVDLEGHAVHVSQDRIAGGPEHGQVAEQARVLGAQGVALVVEDEVQAVQAAQLGVGRGQRMKRHALDFVVEAHDADAGPAAV
jgi:hypothetical protein